MALKAGISKSVIEGSKAIVKGKLKDVGRKQIGKKINDPSDDYSYDHVRATSSEKKISGYTDGENWNEEEILNREYDLLQFASERWSVPCCVDNGTVFLNDDFAIINKQQIDVNFSDCIDTQEEEPDNDEEEEETDNEGGNVTDDFFDDS